MTKRFLLALGLALGSLLAAAQNVSYALPDAGTYDCGGAALSARSAPSATGGWGVVFGVQPNSSLYGNLVLSADGKYRLSNGGGGSYSAKPSGEFKFTTGPLAAFHSQFEARNGRFNIFFQPGKLVKDSDPLVCSRASSAAHVTLKNGPNPGLPGTLTLVDDQGKLSDLAVAAGKLTPYPDAAQGAYPYRARNGELLFDLGDEIIIAAGDGKARIRLPPDQEVAPLDSIVRTRYNYVLSPDGQRYAYELRIYPETVTVLRTRGGSLLAKLVGYQTPAFLPDGRLIVAGVDKGNAGLYLTDAQGVHPQRLPINVGFPSMPSASPDGGQIAFVDDVTRTLKRVKLDGSGLNTLALDAGGTVAARGWPVWSPDGRWIAVIADYDNTPFNTELMVVSGDGDLAKTQVLQVPQLNTIHLPDRPLYRLSWW